MLYFIVVGYILLTLVNNIKACFERIEDVWNFIGGFVRTAQKVCSSTLAC